MKRTGFSSAVPILIDCDELVDDIEDVASLDRPGISYLPEERDARNSFNVPYGFYSGIGMSFIREREIWEQKTKEIIEYQLQIYSEEIGRYQSQSLKFRQKALVGTLADHYYPGASISSIIYIPRIMKKILKTFASQPWYRELAALFYVYPTPKQHCGCASFIDDLSCLKKGMMADTYPLDDHFTNNQKTANEQQFFRLAYELWSSFAKAVFMYGLNPHPNGITIAGGALPVCCYHSTGVIHPTAHVLILAIEFYLKRSPGVEFFLHRKWKSNNDSYFPLNECVDAWFLAFQELNLVAVQDNKYLRDFLHKTPNVLFSTQKVSIMDGLSVFNSLYALLRYLEPCYEKSYNLDRCFWYHTLLVISMVSTGLHFEVKKILCAAPRMILYSSPIASYHLLVECLDKDDLQTPVLGRISLVVNSMIVIDKIPCTVTYGFPWPTFNAYEFACAKKLLDECFKNHKPSLTWMNGMNDWCLSKWMDLDQIGIRSSPRLWHFPPTWCREQKFPARGTGVNMNYEMTIIVNEHRKGTLNIYPNGMNTQHGKKDAKRAAEKLHLNRYFWGDDHEEPEDTTEEFNSESESVD